MDTLIIGFLQNTAWRIDAPVMFGAFHISALVIITAAAFLSARKLSSGTQNTPISVPDASETGASDTDAADMYTADGIPVSDKTVKIRGIRVLASAGWLLAALEAYKQLFLYYIVNSWHYDWWFFPFQLCSVPMYLCILLPFARGRVRASFLTFMATFTFISAAAALIFPEDFMRSYVSLTVHGFVWHGILLFISLYILFSGMADLSRKGFVRASILFACLCVPAVLINAATEPLMNAAHAANEIPNSYAAMFYLSPYHISPQPVVGAVQQMTGIPAGLMLYALAIIAAAGLFCMIADHVFISFTGSKRNEKTAKS
ncbi:MAG: YwaF family protein [Mogibacterium sp.]|nr:YwaF family protein [Mogibacterium sp.]